MADYAKLREAFGLAADSSDDEVHAAMRDEVPVEPAPAVVNTAGATAAEPTPEATTPDTNATLVVSKSVWDDTQNTIRDLSEFVAKTKRDERDSVLAQAVADGKFRPSQLNDFRALWDQNPDGTRNLVDKMTPNSALAVAALGVANALEDDDLDAEFAGLFPPSAKGR